MRPIVGVDVATRLPGVGLALGTADPDTGLCVVSELVVGGSPALPGGRATLGEMIAAVAPWIARRIGEGPALLAIDAPLGWPDPLRRALATHAAGELLTAPADRPQGLWRRVTDEAAHRETGRLPLEVGADRIARAAQAALTLLDAVRARVAAPIPHLLDPAPRGAVEVYPAGLLAALGADAAGYKTDPDRRAALLDGPLHAAGLRLGPGARAAALSSDHGFDAALCVLAGADLLLGRSAPVPPEHRETAGREGWIHVRSRHPG